jgi:hypothetical protein
MILYKYLKYYLAEVFYFTFFSFQLKSDSQPLLFVTVTKGLLTRFSTLFSGTSPLIIIVDVDILTVKNIDTLLILPMFFKIVVPLS